MILEKVKELACEVTKAKEDLNKYINSIDLKNLVITEDLFLTLMPYLPCTEWMSNSFSSYLFDVCQKSIWDFEYSKHETVSFIDLCERISDLEDHHFDWAENVEEARQKAIEAIWFYAIKHKLSGFKLDW